MKKLFKKETRKLLKIFSNPTFLYLTLLGNGVLLLATTAVYWLEKNAAHPQIKSYFDALWWGISTITTVAYGDILPQTFGGRLIGIVLMYTGTVLFISFTGIVLATLMKEEVEEGIAPLQKEVRLEEREQVKLEKALQQILNRLDSLERKSLSQKSHPSEP